MNQSIKSLLLATVLSAPALFGAEFHLDDDNSTVPAVTVDQSSSVVHHKTAPLLNLPYDIFSLLSGFRMVNSSDNSLVICRGFLTFSDTLNLAKACRETYHSLELFLSDVIKQIELLRRGLPVPIQITFRADDDEALRVLGYSTTDQGVLSLADPEDEKTQLVRDFVTRFNSPNLNDLRELTSRMRIQGYSSAAKAGFWRVIRETSESLEVYDSVSQLFKTLNPAELGDARNEIEKRYQSEKRLLILSVAFAEAAAVSGDPDLVKEAADLIIKILKNPNVLSLISRDTFISSGLLLATL